MPDYEERTDFAVEVVLPEEDSVVDVSEVLAPYFKNPIAD